MWSTVIYIKTSIFVMCAALLTVFTPQRISAQELFNGVVTYKMSMNGASAQPYTVYYRGRDYMTDMPLTKLRTLYLSEEKKMYSIRCAASPRLHTARRIF